METKQLWYSTTNQLSLLEHEYPPQIKFKKALNFKYRIQNFINIFKLQQISNYANQQQN